MNKVYLNKAGEDWILDRLRTEWYELNKKNSTNFLFKSDVVWICSPWTWKKLSKRHLRNKVVICSIYHIDEEKFSDKDLIEFNERDKFVDFYHVISENTKLQLKKLTSKKIVSIPFWVNQNIWFEIKDKNLLKNKLEIPQGKFIIGSFQRDTEGSDLKSPKLSKGPDRLLEIFKHLKENKDIFVILSGKRRNYVIDQLVKEKINFKYFEMVDNEQLNELYNILDLYIVASRVEGGPQAIMECAITKTPIISTNVGVAPEILESSSIFKMENFMSAKPNIDFAYNKVLKYTLPNGIDLYRSMIFNDKKN